MTDLINVLLEMRSGKVAADLNNKFQELLDAVLNTAKSGKLVIELELSPEKMGMGGIVLEVAAEHQVKMKKPELPIGKAFFFVTKDGDLSREDPEQTAMFQEPQSSEPARREG